MGKDESQGSQAPESLEKEQVPKKSRGAGRTRVFAAVVYPDSSPQDWQERLTQEHVSAFISPLHDRDENPDGTAKKEHWHLMLMFEGVKSQDQVDALLDRVLGPNRVKHYENVNSTRGYARYLCHLDNPEKAQYDKADVTALCGADYAEIISLPSDDWDVLDQIFDYIEDNKVRYYAQFMRYCRKERRDWWKLLMARYSYVVINYMKSEVQRARDERDELDRAMREYGRARMVPPVDVSTGEVIEESEGK